MIQIAVRLDDELVAQVDGLVRSGAVDSRSQAVREGLRAFVDQRRRRAVGEAIVEGYRRCPQTEEETAWSDEATAAMIAEEPW
ncbi:MAG: ribbon-helix-helix domain-containing protein [bacterium]|nr:ribbon-helix-helix domain-containing protein [bacterium]MDE0668008.1 ribbon-helix-helix domain-containing protein [bacterium]MXZ29921.1 ribbon-helix-helix protein, CopG family [Acidimicrobiia bacterium]MYB24343.1 ribbon-helix-helix protein, CopG family [Acidimicrobiia bacterium]MYJ13638.1 ribbon-helix-helix protein, CopG family [Acidimicrobiia bacterium]